MTQCKVMIIGSGGREHALAWKIAQSPSVKTVIVAPGNDAMGFYLNPDVEFERWSCDVSKGETEFKRLAGLARENRVDLTVVGPDNPLADGIVDCFEGEGLKVFGPSADAAKIEADKGFAKEVMMAADIPTAQFKVFQSIDDAKEFLISNDWTQKQWVIKATGLAFGKGVHVASDQEDAITALEKLFPISNEVLIEERLEGEEVSWIAICDGKNAVLMDSARDYKRLLDGQKGPNTGGMGAYSPVGEYSNDYTYDKMVQKVFQPTLDELARRGTPFKGFLYAGLMVNPKTDNFWVLEFNARFGDPEAQALLPRLESDLFEWCDKAAEGNFDSLRDSLHVPTRLNFISEYSVFTVAAACGYPVSPRKNDLIRGNFESQGRLPDYFFAGVKRDGNRWLTSGGRVYGALGLGNSLEIAKKESYEKLDRLHFDGIQFRKDIGGDE